jgi:TetR/AcrR family transcriptional repressor of nem operon
MHRGSFYRSFGDKEHAFREALDRYMAAAANEHVFPAVEGRGSPTRRLLKLLWLRLDAAFGVGAGSPGDEGRPGCLIVNTAIEVAPHDPEIRSVVAVGLEGIRQAIEFLIREAIAVGEVDRDVDVRLATDQLFTLLQGANVLVRAGAVRRDLRRLLEQSLRGALNPNVSLP